MRVKEGYLTRFDCRSSSPKSQFMRELKIGIRHLRIRNKDNTLPRPPFPPKRVLRQAHRKAQVSSQTEPNTSVFRRR